MLRYTTFFKKKNDYHISFCNIHSLQLAIVILIFTCLVQSRTTTKTLTQRSVLNIHNCVYWLEYFFKRKCICGSYLNAIWTGYWHQSHATQVVNMPWTEGKKMALTSALKGSRVIYNWPPSEAWVLRYIILTFSILLCFLFMHSINHYWQLKLGTIFSLFLKEISSAGKWECFSYTFFKK